MPACSASQDETGDARKLSVQTSDSSVKTANAMLHEFKRLGKAREAELKLCLNKLASISVLPGGFVRHSDKVVDLTEEIMLVVRGGAASAGENARRMLKWHSAFSAAWRNVDCLNLPKVLQAYAAGREEEEFVDISLLGQKSRKSLSLKKYSQMDQAVFMELYIRSIDNIRQHLPAALGQHPVPAKTKEAVAILASKAAVHGCAIHICTACTGLLHWNKVKDSDTSLSELSFAWDALQVEDLRCAEIKQVWQQACAAAIPDFDRQVKLEAELKSRLAAHRAISNESFHGIMNTVKQLIHSYEKVRGILGAATMYIFYNILTPYEFGILSAVQLPRSSVQHIIASKTYPFAQPGKLIELNVI